MQGYLVLKNGSVYAGERFGSEKDLLTEVVFSTGMTGYQETMTDPSYFGQTMVFTYPLIGNYGINLDDNEGAGSKPAVDAIIVKDLARRPANFRSVMTLADFAKEEDLPGLAGVDTRKLAKEIRDHGSMPAVLVSELNQEKIDALFAQDYPSLLLARAKKEEEIETFVGEADGPKIALLDFGLKGSIVKALQKRGATVTVFPGTTPASVIEASNPDGVLLSNGPGDPTQYGYATKTILELQNKYPIMGICLGHQLFAIANGAKTYKMKFGYRGFNHAVTDVDHKRKYFTSQNHGYAVDRASLAGTNLEVTHEEINAETVEGVRLKDKEAFSVQFHPDASPGPHDAEYIFDNFINKLTEKKGA
ncbi:carbamoyl phosphate synthase small subunit [Fructobacillus tropaeoli]|uniref:carbamoyl phosphate synthase small subunit n=1 Tax=Fructobacillus tropaeoli TaxID=709323 RepID=UPI0019419BAD|nr:carbamoyl phosphate synthase small subunit [Fructobacillus tropaeoli]GIC70860.1 carbamoyl phosphate synthase small subunit [Fructobacillus tropaeoli]